MLTSTFSAKKKTLISASTVSRYRFGLMEGGEDMGERVSSSLSWCFEPSQPRRITSGLKVNFSPSVSYFPNKSHVNHHFPIASFKYFTQKLQKLSAKALHANFTTTHISAQQKTTLRSNCPKDSDHEGLPGS